MSWRLAHRLALPNRCGDHVRQIFLAAGASLVLVIAIAGCTPVIDNTEMLVVPASGLGPLDEIEFRIVGRQPDDGQDEIQAHFNANHRAREEFIAACMSEQGFTYVPFLDGVPTLTLIGDDTDYPTYGSRAFAEQFGFGISTDGVTFSQVWSMPQTTNPNDELNDAMSPAELLAWQAALWGTLSHTGCQDAAHQAISVPTEFSSLQADIQNLRLVIASQSTTDFIALNMEWSSCMIDAGFPSAQSPTLLQRSIGEEFALLRGQTVEAGGAILGVPEPLDAQQASAFTEREVAAALADYDCRIQVSYQQRQQQIDFALQQEFVNQHRNELEAWAEHAESLRAGW